jgi:hypothetical protein
MEMNGAIILMADYCAGRFDEWISPELPRRDTTSGA